MEITKEKLIIGTANHTRNVKCIYITPREKFIWSIIYKPLGLIFEEFSSKESAEKYIDDFIKDVMFTYRLKFEKRRIRSKRIFRMSFKPARAFYFLHLLLIFAYPIMEKTVGFC